MKLGKLDFYLSISSLCGEAVELGLKTWQGKKGSLDCDGEE